MIGEIIYRKWVPSNAFSHFFKKVLFFLKYHNLIFIIITCFIK